MALYRTLDDPIYNFMFFFCKILFYITLPPVSHPSDVFETNFSCFFLILVRGICCKLVFYVIILTILDVRVLYAIVIIMPFSPSSSHFLLISFIVSSSDILTRCSTNKENRPEAPRIHLVVFFRSVFDLWSSKFCRYLYL